MLAGALPVCCLLGVVLTFGLVSLQTAGVTPTSAAAIIQPPPALTVPVATPGVVAPPTSAPPTERTVSVTAHAYNAARAEGSAQRAQVIIRPNFDARGQTIGRSNRYRGVRMWMGSRSVTPRYGTVELYGRAVAEVNDALNWGSGFFDTGDARRQLVRVKIESLTTDEKNWLLALVAVELYYNALRTAAAIN